MPAKIDFRRALSCYSARRDTPEFVDVPDLQYLMIDGHGDPNGPAYADAVAALYPLAYTLKFASASQLGRDYVVMPLEGLWWAQDMEAFTAARDKAAWSWTLLIMVPEWVTGDMVADAGAAVRAKAAAPARVDDVRLEPLSEGRCVQALHVGSFDDEAGLLHRMHHEVVPHNGYAMAGKHHEIYLSDPRRTDPSRLRTILRQPVVTSSAARVDPP